MKPLLDIEQLYVNYESQPVLHGVTLSLACGEILCLLGRSGSGKTTLLRAIAGLEEAASGIISCDGRDLRDTPPHRRGFGMMFQDYALFPHKNVAENIAFGLEMQGMKGNVAAARVKEMLELVNLAGYGERRIDELSGGQQQRVALARSLAPHPRLLLLDEPLGSLDRSLRDHLAEEIRIILKQLEVTAIFVTHDQKEAFSVADRVAVLLDGRLARLDTPEAVYRDPQQGEVASFLGFANFVEGRLDGCEFTSPLGRLRFDDMENKNEPEQRTLLLRPEGATLAGATEGRGLRVSGTVRSRICLGGYYRLRVEKIDGLNAPLTFEIPLAPTPPAAGSVVEIDVPENSMVLLAQSET
ncbi:ABC transporter ATP-binding protein [Desulforhopalus vacuolatus]|uniref:ABC transporter ATP-binding protein n=1 Tax=Desulforhopalus vacuolatus TaxID=40414 RepID=UPI00196598C7|nr:ABC transporter ATP-binding protein [Desulforhopalus vacuolatus]MBM9518579.1 ABC transporter ATP-binding protein [Desulforhopalus vacuolatus]